MLSTTNAMMIRRFGNKLRTKKAAAQFQRSCLSTHYLKIGSRDSVSSNGANVLNSQMVDRGDDGVRQIAYRQIPGPNEPTIVVIPGFHSYSHMDGFITKCILRYCDINEISCIVYDHECMGRSTGNVKSLLFSHWVEDAVRVIDDLTTGKVVLVSCSMGGWLSLLAAQRIKDAAKRLHGMVLYAPAINYVRPYYELHRSKLDASIQARLDAGDPHVISHVFGDALIKKDFSDDSIQYEIDLETERNLKIDCPVRIIHGLEDKEVKAASSLNLVDCLTSKDVDLTIRKIAPHRAERTSEIELILNTTDRLIKENPIKGGDKASSGGLLMGDQASPLSNLSVGVTSSQ